MRTHSRLPFAPTIRPSLGFGSGGFSVFIYAIFALVLVGYSLYQIKAQHLSVGNWRVLVAWAGAAYFAVRAGLMLMSGRDKDEKEAADE